MNIKKIIVGGVGVAMLFSVGFVAMAENDAVGNSMIKKPAQPMVVQIGERGGVLLRGTVEVVGTNSLTVKSWGGSWVVNISSSTKLAPKTDVSQFMAGDFVGVQGTVSTAGAWTIDATFVRNWTERKEMKEERKENKEIIKDIIRPMTARNWEGFVVGDVNSDGSFKLKVGVATYDIKLATGAKVVNNGFETMVVSDIKSGDKVRVYGPLTDTTITAEVVRDTAVKATYNVKSNVK